MAYISKQFTEEVVLPDGSVASSVADVDRFLKKSGLARSSDYSTEYVKNIRLNHERNRRNQLLADFLYNYKRMIWK
ncbi:MAG: hypothetical protein IJ852_01760 [Alphaproteobacteria bacterium]|nr:hypothetical protein [Alphaproteobacteria bacterium]